MTDKKNGVQPYWAFVAIMVGGFIACGIYLGMMRLEGVTTGNLVRTIGYGALGFVMLWGVLGRR